MNKGTDIEALVRQNENITCRDGAAEKDIMPATQTGDNQFQMPGMPSLRDQSASQNPKELSVNYGLYFIIIGVQFIVVSSIVFAGLIYAAVNIQWNL